MPRKDETYISNINEKYPYAQDILRLLRRKITPKNTIAIAGVNTDAILDFSMKGKLFLSSCYIDKRSHFEHLRVKKSEVEEVFCSFYFNHPSPDLYLADDESSFEKAMEFGKRWASFKEMMSSFLLNYDKEDFHLLDSDVEIYNTYLNIKNNPEKYDNPLTKYVNLNDLHIHSCLEFLIEKRKDFFRRDDYHKIEYTLADFIKEMEIFERGLNNKTYTGVIIGLNKKVSNELITLERNIYSRDKRDTDIGGAMLQPFVPLESISAIQTDKMGEQLLKRLFQANFKEQKKYNERKRKELRERMEKRREERKKSEENQ